MNQGFISRQHSCRLPGDWQKRLSTLKWLIILFILACTTTSAYSSATIQKAAEATLEGQVVLDTSADSGAGSLRELIDNATPDLVIQFDTRLSGESIQLLSPITVSENMTINGLGANQSVITGGGENGIFILVDNANLTINGLQLRGGNMPNGGAIAVTNPDIQLTINDSQFLDNFAASRGGAINNQGGTVNINRSIFRGNQTQQLGGAINNQGEGRLIIRNTTFTENMSIMFDGGAITNLDGLLDMDSSTVFNNFAANIAGGIGNNVNSTIIIRNSIVANNTTGSGVGMDIGNLADIENIQSMGGNLVSVVESTTTVNTVGIFDQENDQTGTVDSPLDPLFEEPLGELFPVALDSPALDAIVTGLDQQEQLPCGLVDARGLPRPQDGSGDGVFGCDVGAVERQGGADIGAPQSGAYFDTSRNGEGQVVEVLANNVAVLSEFTFGPDGGQLWWTAVGQRIGNSLVFENILRTDGGFWGSALDPAAITRTPIGQMAMIFSNCESSSMPGRAVFQANDDSGLTDLLNTASRLTTVVACDGSVTNPLSTRTGSYFSPERSGEGLQYIEQSDGSVALVFYGYTPAGELFWTIAGSVSVDDDVVAADMLFPEQTTVFGAGFNADDVSLAAFGRLTLTFSTDETVLIDIQPVIEGFEPVSYLAQRLTTPIGLNDEE